MTNAADFSRAPLAWFARMQHRARRVKPSETPRVAAFLYVATAMALAALIPEAHAEEANCSVTARVTDPNPAGLRVRQRPDVRSPVLANLKPAAEDAVVSVNAVAARPGWVKIGGAHAGDTQLFADEGWVSAQHVAVTLRGEHASQSGAKQVAVRLSPSTESRVGGMVDVGVDVRLRRVRCGWVEVAWRNQRGWVRSAQLCSDARSRCESQSERP